MSFYHVAMENMTVTNGIYCVKYPLLQIKIISSLTLYAKNAEQSKKWNYSKKCFYVFLIHQWPKRKYSSYNILIMEKLFIMLSNKGTIRPRSAKPFSVFGIFDLK